MQWTTNVFDDTHTPAGSFPTYAIGRNDVDLKSQIDLINAANLANLPLNWTQEYTYDRDAMTMYFLLDKDSLMVIYQTFAANFVSDAVANQPPFYPVLVNPQTSPKYTGWKDPLGIRRKPPPSDKKGPRGDFSGAPGLVSALQGLLLYSETLRAAGRLRDAGIVKYAYDQVIDLRFTITEAFDYLRKVGLV